MWGGNYAGHKVSFCPRTGELLPLPGHYVPEALKEWGQIPTSLEVLTSEEEATQQRLETVVLPDTGCGIDNLETIMTKQTLQPTNRLESQASQKVALGFLVTGPSDTKSTYFEAAFPHTLEDEVSHGSFRCRVAVAIESGSKPITMVIERLVEEMQEKVMIADTRGGGLDGQSVGRWLGRKLNSARWRGFAESCHPNNDPSSLSLPLGVQIDRQDQYLVISKEGGGSVSIALDSVGSISSVQT